MPVYPDSFGLRGLDLAGLWDADNKYAIEFYDNMVWAAKHGQREMAMQLGHYWDMQLFYKHDDQRSKIDPKLEPLSASKQPNKILKDGMTRLMLICADKSAEFFWFVASGTGTSTPTIGQKNLDAENARVDMRADGHMDAFGNILFFRARFGTGIPTATIREFGGCDEPEDPSKFAWRVVLPEAEKVEHVQFQTWYSASHYLIASAK